MDKYNYYESVIWTFQIPIIQSLNNKKKIFEFWLCVLFPKYFNIQLFNRIWLYFRLWQNYIQYFDSKNNSHCNLEINEVCLKKWQANNYFTFAFGKIYSVKVYLNEFNFFLLLVFCMHLSINIYRNLNVAIISAKIMLATFWGRADNKFDFG